MFQDCVAEVWDMASTCRETRSRMSLWFGV